MWYQRFPIVEDINLMSLMIDNGVLHEIIPFLQAPRSNTWTNAQRHVPYYRPYYARRSAFGFDVDDIFDIGITFTHGRPIMRVFTDLIVMSEEQKEEDIPTPINLSMIMEEEETKEEQSFHVDNDDDANLDETLSIDLIVCPSCNSQCTLEDQEGGLCCQPHLYCNLHSRWEGPIYRLPCCMSVPVLDSAVIVHATVAHTSIQHSNEEQSILSHPNMTLM